MRKTSSRVGVTGQEIPGEIRLADAETLVKLRSKGERIGLNGRWSAAWLAENLPRDVALPIRVMLINLPSFGTPDDWAPLEGRCYRCLVVTPRKGGESSQFSIDIDSVDFEKLDVMPPDKVLLLAHWLLDELKIERVPWANMTHPDDETTD